MSRTLTILTVIALSTPAGLAAQSLAKRVAAAPDGIVRFAFAARSGICGDGANIFTNGDHRVWIGRHRRAESDGDSPCPCDEGPVRIALKVAGHRVVDLVTRVGGHWRDESRTVTDLGEVPAAQAAGFLLDLAESDRSIGSDAIFPATIADSVEVWPRLLAMGRNRSLAREARNQAVFWLSQAAGEAATRGLDSLVNDENGDREIRKQAVFALSQRPHEEGTTALLKVARTNRDPEIRRTALFWLGQSQDPRALDLFEELLTRR